jgi:hypothetical protein
MSVFASNDNFDPIKLNQKTTFVGKSSQVAFITPQSGQQLYITTSEDSAYPPTRFVTRNSANDTWEFPEITESSELSSGSTSSGGNTLGNGQRRYNGDGGLTFDSTYKFYIITGLEYRTPNSGASTFVLGVDVINAGLASTPLAAIAAEKLSPSNDTVYKITEVSSRVLYPGTVVRSWVQFTGTTISGLSGSDANSKTVAYSATPPFSNNNAWLGASTGPAIKIYYRGYS